MDVGKIAEFAVTFMTGVIGSKSLWALVESKNTKSRAGHELLLIVSRSEILTLGRHYIEQGYVRFDEYDEFCEMYKHYVDNGGNGLAKKIFEEVGEIPVLPDRMVPERRKKR